MAAGEKGLGGGLGAGKVPAPLLERLLAGLPSGEGVRVGPGVGLDGAVLEVEGGLLVAASDPITFASDEIGWYAVHVNANDVACMGGLPRWFLAVFLFPPGTPEPAVESVQRQVVEALDEVGAALVGGHTEAAPDLPRPVVCGTMLGPARRLVSAAEARPGDVLLLAGPAAVEATAIAAREAGERLRGRVPPSVVERARAFLRDPGISVVRAARAALEAGARALHDPTEGGVLHGIRELCRASGTGAEVEVGAVEVRPETRAVLEPLGIDPLGAIASGALLAAAPPDRAAAVEAAVRRRGVAVARVGRLLDAKEGIVLREEGGTVRPLPPFAGDEIGKLF